MPSHLTRVVFRTITANKPLLSRRCCHRASRLRPRPPALHGTRLLLPHGARTLPRAPQRGFLDLFKPRRKLKPVELPAGLATMAETGHALQRAVRPPPPQDVADAFRAYFAQTTQRFEDLHMTHARAAFGYLLDNPRPDGSPWFTRLELESHVYAKMLHPSTYPNIIGKAHLQFGHAILAEMARMLKDEVKAGTADPVVEDAHMAAKVVLLLAHFGDAAEAAALAAQTCTYDKNAPRARRKSVLLVWLRVLSAIAQKQSVDDMVRTADVLQVLSIPITEAMQKELVVFFAGVQDVERAKFWYSHPISDPNGQPVEQRPHGKTSAALLKACAYKDRTFGQRLVSSILETSMQDKRSWDAILLWSAAIGKGPDEVDRMMNVLIRRNHEARREDPSINPISPDVNTINGLVELCIARNDPYAAERYIALGEKRGISPNERTFAMQMEYRISVGDLHGARAAYLNLQGAFSGAEHSVAVINQLIQALCVSKLHNFDDLMAIVDDLHERKAKFDPQTTAALTLLHLRRGEIPDAMDLLQVHAFHYSPEGREIIRKALSLFILDSETSIADAWDAYQILRNVIPETSKHDRMTIMKHFFSRKRSDMACHVFFHMRNHSNDNIRADQEVYTAAFTGYARCADSESLELTHNQLRLDLSINMDTKLRNAMMLAYASTEQNNKALEIWREICESQEGPTYNSIVIAFRSCETMHWGGEHAKAIWKRLKEQDVDIDKNIWTAYMCAIARNHYHDEALALIETVNEEYGIPPDLHM